MPADSVTAVRTLALVGDTGVGKTSLVEALLFATGAIKARGSVEKGTTVTDFDPQEKDGGHSISTAAAHFTWKGAAVDLLDTPGLPDFAGQANPALAAVDTALLVVNAQSGVGLVTERMFRAAGERGLDRMIVVNKIDAPNVDLGALIDDLRSRFGKECLVLDLPAHGGADVVEVLDHEDGESDFASVAAAHRAIVDQLIEEDEDLLAKFMEDGADPSAGELHAPFEKAMRAGHLIPILFTSARTGAGVPELLHVIETLAPNPTEVNPPRFYRGELGGPTEDVVATPDPTRHVLAHVFKVAVDPYMGKVGMFRVYQGTVVKDMTLYAGSAKKPLRAAHLYKLFGKDFVEVERLLPGEIGAVAKVDELSFDVVLHDSHDDDSIHLAPIVLPRPLQGLAVETKKKGDEQRLFDVLHKLEMEDPCFRVERHPVLHETVILGLGDVHLRTLLGKMSSRYKLELDTRPPRVPYRETITGNAEGHCRHKKQTGGAGQFGEVYLRVEPLPRGTGFEFVDAVRGGVIPGIFLPAIEKGVRQALATGVVAGYEVVDVRVTVYDGKTHPVDGKEIAFTTAGRKAFLEAFNAAKPILLEPIVNVEVLVPGSFMGDIASDLATRRGQVSGTEPSGPEMYKVSGVVPLAEVTDYSSRLKSMTGGAGAWTMSESHYAPVPPQVQARLVEAYEHPVEED